MSRVREVVYSYRCFMEIERFRKVRFRVDPPGPDGRTKTFLIEHWVDPTHTRLGLPAGWKHLIYNLPAVLKAKRTGEDIWWTEGEKDADSLIELGIVATTHHGGAGHVSAEQAEWLIDTRGRVVLVMDRDLPGAADALRRHDMLRDAAGLRERQIVVVRAADGKDASDHLAAGFGLSEFRPVPIGWLRTTAATVGTHDYAHAGYGRGI